MVLSVSVLVLVGFGAFVSPRGRWAHLRWLPLGCAALAAAAYLAFAVDDGRPARRGPGAGGVFFLLVWAGRLLATLIAVACALSCFRRLP